jgi:hypothetical protein
LFGTVVANALEAATRTTATEKRMVKMENKVEGSGKESREVDAEAR